MPHPTWLTNRVHTDVVLATAAARQTATDLHAQGRDHYTDPAWRETVADAHRAVDKAQEIGLNVHDVLDASKAAGTSRMPSSLCTHNPPCPTAESPDREDAQVVAAYPQQGWSLLCNAVLLFEDTGELLPNGQIIAPHRPLATV